MSSNHTSVINHKLRIEFGMTMIEYCIIQEIAKNEEMNNKWYLMEVQKIMKLFGISRATVYNSLISLQEKDLLIKNKNNDKLYATTLLFKKFFLEKIE